MMSEQSEWYSSPQTFDIEKNAFFKPQRNHRWSTWNLEPQVPWLRPPSEVRPPTSWSPLHPWLRRWPSMAGVPGWAIQGHWGWSHGAMMPWSPKKSSELFSCGLGGMGQKLYRRLQVLDFRYVFTPSIEQVFKKTHIYRTLLTSQNFEIWVFQECFEARLTHAHGVGHKEIQWEAPISYIFRANHVSWSSNLRSASSWVNYNELTVLPHWNDG